MSLSVIVAPDVLAAAATDVAGLGSSLGEAHWAATASTTVVVAAAEDEVSAATAELFSGYGREFQALGAQAAKFHAQFVQTLNTAGKAYANAETTSLSPLKSTLSQVVAAATPNLCIAVSGVRVVEVGSAFASGRPGPNLAIAVGAHSTARVLNPLDVAVAAGEDSRAEVGEGYSDLALAIGPAATARVFGYLNVAIASGESSYAEAEGGSWFVGGDVAIAVGSHNQAYALDRSGNFAGVFGGDSNVARAGVDDGGGSHNVAIIDGEHLSGATAEAQGNGVVTIVPERAEPNLGISVDGTNLVELGNAHAQSGVGDAAIAYGDGSQADSLGGKADFAVAFGTGTHTIAQGGTNAAFAFGNYDTAEAHGDRNLAGVLDGAHNTATATSEGPPNYHIALVLGGNNEVAATDHRRVSIVPALWFIHSLG